MLYTIKSKSWTVSAYTTDKSEWPLECHHKFAVFPERAEAGQATSWSGSSIGFRTLDEAKALYEVLGKLIGEVEDEEYEAKLQREEMATHDH